MDSNPICSKIPSIDFSNEEDLKQILFQDKHTRVEGLCSEIIFEEDILKDNFGETTRDFWFSPIRAGYHIRKIVTDDNYNLTPLDYRLLDGFRKVKCPVSIVRFDVSAKSFIEAPHEVGRRYEEWPKGTVIRPTENTIISNETDRDKVRLEKAFHFLKDRGLLRDCAIKRLFANCYLAGYAWDIDAFIVADSSQIVALEVKQKFPSQKGTFGINEGQKNLFSFLVNRGMPVIHIVLKKPVNDKTISGVDLLTHQHYVDDTVWLYTRFLPSKLQQAYEKAPAATSIFGSTGITYSHIDMKQFSHLKKLRSTESNVREKLLAGINK